MEMAISFQKLEAVMQQKGVKKFDLRKAGVNANILDKALQDGNVDTRTISKLCRLLECQPGDIMEYVEDAKLRFFKKTMRIRLCWIPCALSKEIC